MVSPSGRSAVWLAWRWEPLTWEVHRRYLRWRLHLATRKERRLLRQIGVVGQVTMRDIATGKYDARY